MKEKYISVDIEGASVSPPSYIREIGACEVGNTSNNFFWENLDMEFNEERLKLAMELFEEWLQQFSHPIFVSFNSWDWLHIKYCFENYLGRCPFGRPGRSIDIKVAYMFKMDKPYSETSKREIVKIFPPTQPHTHNGLEDSIEQAEIFEQILNYKLYNVSLFPNWEETD